MFVLTAAVLQDDLSKGGRGEVSDVSFHLLSMKKAKTNPDIRVLVSLGQVQHVVHGQHPRGSLGEVHGRVQVVLRFRHQGRDTEA